MGDEWTSKCTSDHGMGCEFSQSCLGPRNFWEELLDGHLMPSFDPRRSQTNDVVRQAIIPSSRVGRGGRALVDIWEKEPVLPDSSHQSDCCREVFDFYSGFHFAHVFKTENH